MTCSFGEPKCSLLAAQGTVAGQDQREDDDVTDRMNLMCSLHDLTRSAIVHWIEGVKL
jgi:hypothetical protein